jgi:predicted nucleic acid-binding protein
MLAIDTNVLVRLVVADDPDQTRRARDLVDQNEIWIATTVLLESEWVLRSLYRQGPAQVAAAFRSFSGLPGVTLQDPDAAAWALNAFEQGVDFADALHIASAIGREAFVTFDRKLIKSAAAAAQIRLRSP